MRGISGRSSTPKATAFTLSNWGTPNPTCRQLQYKQANDPHRVDLRDEQGLHPVQANMTSSWISKVSTIARWLTRSAGECELCDSNSPERAIGE